jgi:acetyl esterase
VLDRPTKEATVPIDTQTETLVEQIVASGFPGFSNMSVEQAREALVQMRELAGPPEPIDTEDHTIAGPSGDLRVRLYRPDAPEPLPVLVYFHGGGFVCGNLETIDAPLRSLANRSGCGILSVDYRLAPEHPFPAAFDDALAATQWVAENGTDLGLDGDRLAVGGDSCGGGLAAAVCLAGRENGGPPIAFQFLIYPMLDPDCNSASQWDLGEGYLVTREDLLWFWRHYLGTPEAGRSPYASPLLAEEFSRLPPALIITAEFDPLRDEGEAYAAALRAAKVPVDLMRLEGMIHACFQMAGVIDRSKRLVETAATALRRALAREELAGLGVPT